MLWPRLGIALCAAAVVALSALPRILLAAGALPDPLRPFVWSDPLFTYVRGLSGHRLPYLDTPFEYPPVVGAISGLFSVIADHAALYVALWSALLAAAAGVTAWILVPAAGPRRVLWRFALTPELLLLAGLNFDLLATLAFAIALLAARAGRDTRAAVALAIGAATKLFPLAAAPLAVLRARRPVRSAVTIAAVLALTYGPVAIATRDLTGGLGYYAVGIGANLDSPWGLLARLLDTLGVPAAGAIVTGLTLAGLAITYLTAVLPRARASDAAAALGLAVVTTLLWSRLYSPQYSLWLLPLFALLPLAARRFALLAAGDVLVFATISPLTLVRWAPGDVRASALLGALVAGVALRHCALVLTWRDLRAIR